jgi:integration host factor subunit alpha
MNFTKTDIVKNISKKSLISTEDAKNILESFLSIIKNKSKLRSVKLSTFGSFSFKKTPKRFGRNPKTKDSYIIPELNKLNFKPSNKIKENLN